MATIQQQVPDAAVIKGHRSLRSAGAGWLVLNREDPTPVAARDGLSDGAVRPQHRIGVQAQEPRLAHVPGQGLDAVTADQVRPCNDGPAVLNIAEPAAEDDPRLGGQDAGFHIDTCLAQRRDSTGGSYAKFSSCGGRTVI